jgi:hypothetical protein
MKTPLLIIAWLVALLGAFSVALVPFEFLKALLNSEKTMPSLILMVPALCIGSGLLVIALRFVRKKDSESAVVLSQGAGLAAWMSTSGITRKYIHVESLVSVVAAFGIPILIGVAVYYILIRGVTSIPRKDEKSA